MWEVLVVLSKKQGGSAICRKHCFVMAVQHPGVAGTGFLFIPGAPAR